MTSSSLFNESLENLECLISQARQISNQTNPRHQTKTLEYMFNAAARVERLVGRDASNTKTVHTHDQQQSNPFAFQSKYRNELEFAAHKYGMYSLGKQPQRALDKDVGLVKTKRGAIKVVSLRRSQPSALQAALQHHAALRGLLLSPYFPRWLGQGVSSQAADEQQIPQLYTRYHQHRVLGQIVRQSGGLEKSNPFVQHALYSALLGMLDLVEQSTFKVLDSITLDHVLVCGNGTTILLDGFRFGGQLDRSNLSTSLYHRERKLTVDFCEMMDAVVGGHQKIDDPEHVAHYSIAQAHKGLEVTPGSHFAVQVGRHKRKWDVHVSELPVDRESRVRSLQVISDNDQYESNKVYFRVPEDAHGAEWMVRVLPCRTTSGQDDFSSDDSEDAQSVAQFAIHVVQDEGNARSVHVPLSLDLKGILGTAYFRDAKHLDKGVIEEGFLDVLEVSQI